MTAAGVLDLARQHGEDFELEGRCTAGEIGAYLARRPDGSRVVFKWSQDGTPIEWFEWLAARINAIRAVGFPAPRYWTPIEIPGAVLLVQDFVAGSARDEVSDALVDHIIELNTLQRWAALDSPGESWTSFMIRTLTEGAGTWCRHDTLAAHSPTTRQILRFAHETASEVERSALHDGDLCHVDLHHHNLLQHGHGALSAVIDWEGATNGDRAFDLATFAFCLPVASTTRLARERAWRAAHDAGDPLAVAAYTAHMAIRRVDWTLRFHPHEAERWIDISEQALARVR